jgi:hypothetical protein
MTSRKMSLITGHHIPLHQDAICAMQTPRNAGLLIISKGTQDYAKIAFVFFTPRMRNYLSMNDLTKEELMEIKDLIEFDISNYGELSIKSINILIPMYNKIQNMIDNYCDHNRLHTAGNSIYCEHWYMEIVGS